MLILVVNPIIPKAENTEKIDYGLAISNIDLIPESRVHNSNSDSISNPNVTSYQKFYIQFTISHWNPKMDEQWVSFSDNYDRINLDIQVEDTIYETNPSLEISAPRSADSANINELFEGGLTNRVYTRPYSLYLEIRNFANEGLPQGAYQFNHYPVFLTSSEESYVPDDDKIIKYYGVTLESTENGTIFHYDPLPDDWGTVYSNEDTNLINNFSFYVFSFTLFVLYALRKQYTKDR